MKFAGDIWANNPAKDIMSYFSSMGTTSTLDFKPEMSAPGGNIYSNVPGTEPKSIVILALDYAGNVSWTTWGDQSYIKSSMAIQTISVTPTTGINQTKSANISAWAYNRGD